MQPDNDLGRRAEMQKRGGDAHLLTIRAAIAANGCGQADVSGSFRLDVSG
jgi:hypothetical protein